MLSYVMRDSGEGRGLAASSSGLLPLWGYGAAIVAVAAAYVVRLALGHWLGEGASFLVFVLPVVFAVVYGGRLAGLLAGFLSLLAGFSLVSAAERMAPATLVHALLFVLVCGGIGWIGQRLARQQRLAERLRRSSQEEAAKAISAREEFGLLLEAATDYAIFMVDLTGKISTWNTGAERIFGLGRADAIGRHYSIFYPSDGREEALSMANLAQASREGRRSEEVWRVRGDGSEFLADVTTTPLTNATGEPRGYAKVIHDVTDRRAAETALERRERHLQSILATVPDAMVVIDEAGIMISFSATAERLFGYDEADVVGKNVSMLMPNPDRDRHDSYLRRYIETREPHIIGIGRIVTGLRADGSTFPMKLSVGETIVEDQRLFTGFVQDMTEKQYFESKLEQMKSELIHVSRLSAMGTMASTLAHELNQPLTAIATYGEAAGELVKRDGELDRETLHEIITDMAAQALRAGGIVRRLREFVARGEVNKTIEDLPKLISEAGALALVGSREKGIVTQFDYDPDASPVLADRVQIQQVLINLMRNAIEAMEGCPVRRLSVRTALADPETVQVSVADTGPGVSPQIAERLFEAFASTKSNGMGLGLSICRTIVEAHGGRIRAQPAQGGGTEFLFTLLKPGETD